MTGLSDQDVARIAAAVAAELHKNPPPLSDEDVSRIAEAVNPKLELFLREGPKPSPVAFVKDEDDEGDDKFTSVIEKYGEPEPPGPLPEAPGPS